MVALVEGSIPAVAAMALSGNMASQSDQQDSLRVAVNNARNLMISQGENASFLDSDNHIENVSESNEQPSDPVTAQNDADTSEANSNSAAEASDRQGSDSSYVSLYDYLIGELRRGYLLENDEQRYMERREKFYMFLKIPREVERFMFYGIFQCGDAFLFVFTLLPLRFSLALWFLLSRSLKKTFSCMLQNEHSSINKKVLQPAEICDLLKGIILIIVSFLMTYVDTSMLYHMVKSQSVIKLYIIFNMLEVADKLFSSFGQDILDALFWTATEPRDRKREHFGVLPHLLMAVGYVFVHAVFVLLQATTLNVAINSRNKALLTIMMSNNFVELKGMVFKKFEKNNLFQMSCSDVRERFHYVVLLLVVIIQTLKEYNWSGEQFWILVPDCVFVLIAEVVVDGVKHAFITRFNEIPCEVYGDYKVSLAYDLASSKLKSAYSDHSDLISRRMGFIPLPLGAVVFRVVSASISIYGVMGYASLLMGYLCLFSFKVLINIHLLGRACDLIEQHRKSQKEKAPPPRQCTSLPPSRHHSFEDLPATVAHAKSTPHSLNPSVSSSLADISAQVAILQETLEPSPIFCNSTVSLNSLGLNEGPMAGEPLDVHDGNMLNVDYEGIRRRASAGVAYARREGPKRRVSLQEYPHSRSEEGPPPLHGKRDDDK